MSLLKAGVLTSCQEADEASRERHQALPAPVAHFAHHIFHIRTQRRTIGQPSLWGSCPIHLPHMS